MLKFTPALLTLSIIVGSSAAQAQVSVKDAWVRATVAQQKATGAFMQLTAGEDGKLVAISSALTPVVELHEMAMDKDVMKMRQIATLALPAGKTVELKPGGYHVMLLDLKTQLKPGDSVPLSLVFEDKAGKRQTVEVKAEVRALNAGAAAAPAAPDGHQH
ncbi:copper chaperone PCu(A)C [Paucibacter sp. APW11]|uniref:Copper chaperone PCu(A)C n=1 Tax=Roseateles aquae TaxID=3077235 RepID=A0ABU3PEP8_9BURK|nr:copper chaperone PCu(A)C [Paucibacter sp. APW11]MDT9001065.1 copper chaperone PCu(A)C [Paucibacter sp. APW11]